jgi:excinuclease ABC subunit A
MGPEGGAGGGTVIASGTPEDVAANRDSYTGHYLADMVSVPAPAKKRRKVSA